MSQFVLATYPVLIQHIAEALDDANSHRRDADHQLADMHLELAERRAQELLDEIQKCRKPVSEGT
jgi:F0F1-type ATP synthase membrane subunit b/b'